MYIVYIINPDEAVNEMKAVPLYKQIQNDIKKMMDSGILRKGDRVMSEKELSEKYRVSQITSKNAIIGLVEEGLLVRVQGKGTFVRSRPDEVELDDFAQYIPNNGKTIGLIVPTMKTIVDQRCLDAIEQFVSRAGYNLMICITRESQIEESKAIENFLNQGISGLIIFPVENENYNDSILRLSLERFPLVLIDRFLKEIKTYSVSSDNMAGTYEAIKYLLNQDLSSIALVSPEITNTVTDERAKGFEKAFLERKYSIDKNLWCMVPLETISAGKAYNHIYEFLKQNQQIEAVFTVNIELCRYVFSAATALGMHIPGQLKLLTFDPPGILGVPYVQQDELEMSKITVSLLLEQMEGKYEPRRIVVPVTFIENDETKKYTE